ncbi:TonB-dependent receptor, partial [bacterium]|nr:TonB-dependent receptor [bacterium]
PAAPSTAAVMSRVEVDDAVGYRDLGDLLGGVAGFQTARLGGWGATAVPSLRGSAPAQIRFFLDGMPLPDAQTGLAGFGRLPLDRLAAVEVHRGTVPAGLGGVGGAGAVNFITRDGDEGWDAEALAGSFGERSARASWAGRGGDGARTAQILVHGHRADNDFSYVDHNQTFHRSDDDTVRVRENAWLEEWGAWGNGRWHGDDFDVRVAAGFTRRDGGRPGPIGLPSPHASVRYDRLDGQVHVSWRDGLVRLDGAAGRGNEFLFDPQREVGLTPAGTSHARDADLAGRLAWAPTLVRDRLDLTMGADWRGQERTGTTAGREDPERRRRAVGAFAVLDVHAARGRVTLSPAWRWQHTHDTFPLNPPVPWQPDFLETVRDDVSPSVGAVWEVRPATFFVEAHAARTVRQPSWVELFGHRGGVDGNPGLRAERLRSADLAFSLRRGGFTGRVAAYIAETEDKIVFVANGPRSTKAENADRTLARGLETEVGVALPADLRLDANLTMQRVTEEDSPTYDGKRVPFLPDVEAHARLSGRFGAWRPWAGLAHLGDNYRDRYNTEAGRAPARTLVNLGCARDWRPDLLGPAGLVTVQAEVINLTDDAVYDVDGYPLPGRTWRLSARLRY